MKLRTLLLTSAITCFAATGAAYAVDDAVIDEISGALAADGFTRIHLRHGATWVEVEAWGPAGKVERRYDGNGEMLRERLHAGENMPVVDPVGDDGESPIGDRIQTRAQTGAGDGTCDEDCDHAPIQTRAQTRAQTREQTRDHAAAGADDGTSQPDRDRVQLRDGSGDGDGAGERDGSGDGGERKQSRAGKDS